MKLLILVLSLSTVYCRPQTQQGSSAENSNVPVKVTSLPYYGGAQGQYLEIYETADGKISTQIVSRPLETTSPQAVPEETLNYTALEYPELPSKDRNEYGHNIKNIHRSALNIIQLQENAKQRGSLTENEKIDYDRNMRVLNKSAKDLAELQLSEDDIAEDEGLREWFTKKKENSKREQKRKNGNKKGNQNKVPGDKEKEEEKEKPDEKEEEEEEGGDEKDEESDSVVINLPPDDASVAEAKPVGLAVAGPGGIAESKPVATAVVGPAGLAIARPVGTAIAGVSPDQALVPIYVQGLVKPTKKKDPAKGTNKPKSEAAEFLNRLISKYHQV